MNQTNDQLTKPIGLNLLPYLEPLRPFDLFTGKGLLNQSNFIKKENEWILNITSITKNQNSS